MPDGNRRFDMVVISDVHLGAPNCRTEELLDFLRVIRTDRLVIAGDLFDSPRLRRLRCQDVAVLNAIRAMRRSCQVIWLLGNHDPAPEWCSGILDLPTRSELLARIGQQTYLIYHGQRWDPSMRYPRWMIGVADTIYRLAQRVDSSHQLARALKRKSKRFLHVVTQIRRNAVAEAKDRQLTGVIFGHSHVPCDESIQGIHFLNSGSWVEKPCSFVGMRDGLARQYWWDDTTRRRALELAEEEARRSRRVIVPETLDAQSTGEIHDHVLV